MSILTRIKNNQITDNTIEYQKIKDGTLVGTKFNANITLNSNVVILGNLTVANSYAQLNSVNTYINDPLVVFNNNYTSTPAYDVGMLINRNLDNLAPYGSVNAAWVWKEAVDGFVAIMTTETGTTAGAIQNSGFANVFIGNTCANTLIIKDTIDSSSIDTGALQVFGGAGITKALFVGGNVIIDDAGLTTSNTTAYVFNETVTTLNIGRSATAVSIGSSTGTTTINNALVSTGVVTMNSNLVAASGTNSTNNTTGALVVVGGAGIANDVNIGGYIDVDGVGRIHGNLVADSGTVSTNSTTGALVVVGGFGVTGAQNIDGILTSSNTTQSSTTGSGAIVTSGGVGIAKNLNVGGDTVITGNLTVNGTQTIIGTTDLAIIDSVINIHTFANLAPLVSNDGKDIGIKMHYYDYQDSHAALIRDNSTGQLEWYSRGIEGYGNVFQGNAYGVIKTGELLLANSTVSSDRTTGALRVTGGAGIGGNLHAGNSKFASVNDTPIGNAVPNSATFTTAVTTGVLLSAGNIVGNSTTASTGTTTGALVLTGTGGAGIGGQIWTGDKITAGGNIVAASGTDSTSTDTGALVVQGGAGIYSNVFVGGASTFNSNMTAGFDTIIKGNTDETLLWARAGSTYDQVLIGNSAVVANLVTGAKLYINSTDSMRLPTGTTAQRPSNAGGTDIRGMFRYNTTVSALEVYDGAEWDQITTQFTVIVAETFTGDDSTTVFTMANAATTASTFVAINGIIQQPTTSYSVSGVTLTFTEAPATGDVIDVRRLSTTQTVTGIASTNGYMQFLVDNNGAYVYTGATNTSATTYWDTSGAQIASSGNVSVGYSNAKAVIDTFFANTYRTAIYEVQLTSDGNRYQSQSVTVVHDSANVTYAVHGVVQTNGNCGLIEANIGSGKVNLLLSPAFNSNDIRIKKDYILI